MQRENQPDWLKSAGDVHYLDALLAQVEEQDWSLECDVPMPKTCAFDNAKLFNDPCMSTCFVVCKPDIEIEPDINWYAAPEPTMNSHPSLHEANTNEYTYTRSLL